MNRTLNAFILLFLAASCGPDRSKIAASVSLSQDEPANDTPTQPKEEHDSGLKSPLASYEEIILPLVQKHCSQCHGKAISPLFAQEDASAAFSAAAALLDTDVAGNSRLVARIRLENHQCWTNCEENGNEMEKSVQSWINAQTKVGPMEETYAFRSSGRTTLEAQPTEREPVNDPRTIFFEAETGTIDDPMIEEDLTDASGGRFVFTPEAGGGVLQANAPNAGQLTFAVEVEQSATYRLLALVRAPTNAANSFFVSIDNGPTNAWGIPSSEEWQWDTANQQNGQGGDLSFDLDSGSHTVTITEREDGTEIDLLVLTSDPSFEGTRAPGSSNSVLRYQLPTQANAQLELEITSFDERSILLHRPYVAIANGSVRIQGLHILVNDSLQNQARTFALAEQVITAPGGYLSQATMVLPLTNQERDTIAIQLDVMEEN